MPSCRRERDTAISQAAITDGVSALGARVGSMSGVAVGEGRGVSVAGLLEVGAGRESVGADSTVRVGDGAGVEVDVREGTVEVVRKAMGEDAIVLGVDEGWTAVDVSGRMVEVAATTTGFSLAVIERIGSAVPAAVRGLAGGLPSSRRNSSKSRIATINLKRS